VRAQATIASVARPGPLTDLPELTDPQLIAVVNVLNKLVTPAYGRDKKLLSWIIHRNRYIASRYGMTAGTADVFLQYAGFLVAKKRD